MPIADARATALAPAHPPIAPLLARMAPISLDQMDSVALLNRTDTKYLISAAQLAEALGAVADQYQVLEIGGRRLSDYQTLYFDTADFAFYMSHHAGRSNRYKVRSRRYVGTGQAYLELKLKTNKDRTVKRRVATDSFATAYTPEVADFFATNAEIPAPALEPKLLNEFSRMTLVSRSARERATIDLGLRFHGGGRSVALPGVAVVEVKQDGVDRQSAIIQQLHAAGIQPTSFSKYCIGAALLYPQLKHNRFKPKLLLLAKLMGGTCHVY